MIFSFFGSVSAGTTVVTASDLITAALQRLMILAGGAVPAPEDLALGLDRLNDLVDALANESLTVASATRVTWPLTTAASYTVGTGGTVDLPRPTGPQAIGAIGYIDTTRTPPFEFMTGPPLTEDQYRVLPQKALTGTVPVAWYYDATVPYGTLKPWPIVTGSNLLGVLYAPQSVSEFSATSNLIVLPPGYRRFLRDNLAVELASDFGVQVGPVLVESAKTSKADIKRANVRVQDLSTGEAGQLFGRGGKSNIYTGTS